MARVNINIDRGKYKLRWSHRGKRYSLSIGTVSKLTLKAANAKAKLIESDILFDRFDTSLVKYGKSQLIAQNDILTVWDRYKKANTNRIALTSQQNGWKNVDNCLSKVPKNLLVLDRADELVNELLKYYSPGTLKRVLTDLNAAVSSVIEQPYYKLTKLPKTAKPPIECFNDSEVKVIIEAFASNRYQSAYSQFAHDYYTNYVSFLAYTGCRPEEAIALTWSDIGNTICFDKAYSKGILKDTKNHKIRDFPINGKLAAILTHGDSNRLVFPSVSGGYINQKTWHRRYWNAVLDGLVEQGLVRKKLRSYCLRHSFITRCIRHGLDVASVAEISGNKTSTIHRYYLAARDTSELVLPEL